MTFLTLIPIYFHCYALKIYGQKKNYPSSRRIIFYLKSNTMKNWCKGNQYMFYNIIFEQKLYCN